MHTQENRIRRSAKKPKDCAYPLVSIVIPTHNSSKTIQTCLKSIEKQTYKNIEVIISDNFSHDQTVNIARKFGARVLFKGPERATQKNYGASFARGSLLYFVDSDFVLARSTVQKCVQAIRKADALVTSKVSVGKSFWEKTISYKNQLRANDISILAARFMKKDAFLK